MNYLADAGGSAGDENDFSGNIFGKESSNDREEILENHIRRQEKAESHEGEGRSH